MTPYTSLAGAYDALMADVDYEAWARYALSLLALHGVNKGARILDAACGTGKLTLPLAKAGYALTGADASEDMLRLASEKARKAGLNIPFIRQRLEALSVHRPQDAIVCACDGVNYLASEDEVKAFFTAARNALAPNGVLLFDISSRYKLKHILNGRIFGDDQEDVACFWQNVYDERYHMLEIDLTLFIKNGKAFERFRERHIQRAHTALELTRALRQCGLEPLGIYGFLTTDKPARNAERIQFVAKHRDGLVHKHTDLKERLADFSGEYIFQEWKTGTAVGSEIIEDR